jgi:hypothetical protein
MYNFIVEFDESGFPIIVSDIFGEIPVPHNIEQAFRQTNKDFLEMVSQTHKALESHDIRLASDIVDEMERRWGSMPEKIRLLRWQILEDSVDNDDEE